MIIDGALLLNLLLREHVCTIISVLSRCEQLLTYIHVAATPNNFTTLLYVYRICHLKHSEHLACLLMSDNVSLAQRPIES